MTDEPIKLGLMPPLTGLVGIYGMEIVRAAQVACQEVNESGGVLGRPLELVIEDDGSLPESAVSAAERLVVHHGCAALIGNLLSNSRIAVAYRVAEPRKVPYLNFSFYEGSILSRYFFHFAALPNQQIDRMIPYMRHRYGRRMFFAGNNYEWPRGSVDAAKRMLLSAGGEVVGEEYCPIGVSLAEIERLLDQVEAASPDVFVPYFAGVDQVNLLTRFTQRGLKERVAVVMGHYDEMMASKMPPDVREGFYSSNTYFMTVDSVANRSFLARLAALPGVTGVWPEGDGILTNFGEGAYVCVKAFAEAAKQAGAVDPEALIEALKTVAVSGPQGEVRMDPATHHAAVNTYLSRCDADGTFAIVERFGVIEPVLPARYSHQRIGGQALLEEDIRLQARMLEQMSEAVFLVDATSATIVHRNLGTNRMFGYDGAELIGARLSLLDAPADGGDAETFARVVGLLPHKGGWEGEIRGVRRDGTIVWCSVSISAFTHPTHGEVWMCVAGDVSARKQAEAELRAATRRLNDAQSIARMGSWNLDLVTQKLIWSDEVFRLFEIEPKHFGGTYQSFLEAVHPDDRDAVNVAFTRSLADRTPYEMTHRLLMDDGRIKWMHEKGTSDFDAVGKPLRSQGMVQDVTEQKAAEAARTLLEAQLRESQKMQAIGTLAGGIAHDFNNILAAILGNVELAGLDVGPDSPAQESLGEIRKASARARDLVQQILSFSRRQPTDLKRLVLLPILEESARLLRATLPPRVKLEVHADADVPAVRADRTQIQQLVINLATNAMQEMKGRSGRIGIRLDAVTIDAALVAAHPSLCGARPGRAARLAVSDDGPGMDAATLARIFEPFFTTKPVDEGSGLGLSVVHGIVQTHEGVMVVDSEPGEGATFTLYLPAAAVQSGAEEPAQPPTPATAGPARTAERATKLLYVDDDASLVFLVTRLLERRGYRVSGYTRAPEALDALRAAPTAFDLVVTDHNMPGISGLDVARAVRAIRADLPVAVATGFLDDTLRAQAEGAGVRELIFKASALEDLCDAFVRLAETVARGA